jgi:mycothione reductase
MATHHYDLVIVGAGSGNMLPGGRLSGWRVAVVESGRFGGTCLNTGCVPSKMLVHSADVARQVLDAGRFGVGATFTGADWPAIRDRVFSRIDPRHAEAVAYRRRCGVDVFLGEGRFVAGKTLAVGDDVLLADRFVLAAGSRPAVPAIPGLGGVRYLTSDDVMRVERRPGSMLVIGGGSVSAEMSHIFGSLGTAVTIVERSERLLMSQDRDVSASFTEAYGGRFDLRLGSVVSRVSASRRGVCAEIVPADPAPAGGRTPVPQRVEVEALLVAAGRVPNSDRLDVGATGVETDEHGHVRTDRAYRTNVEGIWAFGDLANHFQLKHMANAEARLVRHNLAHPEDPRSLPFSVVPAAVFADPQVATVGATEQRLQAERRPYLAATRRYGDTAFGWALEETRGFAKVLADPETRLLLGAHIIGPQASTLIQPLVQAICLGNTVDEVAEQVLYIHPALGELVEQVLLEVGAGR